MNVRDGMSGPVGVDQVPYLPARVRETASGGPRVRVVVKGKDASTT